jgi:Fe2+ transport system protein FeoA
VGGSAQLLYYAPWTAYDNAKRAKAERPVAVEEMITEALRRLFLKPGADRYRGFVELLGNGKLALMLEDKTESSYVFKLYRVEEGGGLEEPDIKLRIEKVGEGITYTLIFGVERWLGFFKQELEVGMKAAVEVGGRLPVEDRFSYMAGWVDSDVAITRNREGERVLKMGTTHLWQLAETYALFGWSVVGLRMNLTLEGPKLVVDVEAPLKNLDDAIRISAEGGWLKMLGTKAGLEDLMHVKSWDDLKRWVAGHWGEVIDAVKKQLKSVEVGSGFDLTRALEELEGLKSRLADDKIAREVIAPALLLMQGERLGVNEETLRCFAAVISDAVGGDGFVSAAMRVIDLTSGEREIVLLWAAALAAYGIKTKVVKAGGAYKVVASGDDAVKLAGLYFLYGPPLLEGDERVINYKLAEAVELGAEGLDIRWEGLRQTKNGAAADLIISVGGAAVKYNIYLSDKIMLQFASTDRGRVELAARLLKLAGVSAEVNKVESSRDVWRVVASTDILAAGRKELRDALVELIRAAVEKGWVNADKADLWLEKLERGFTLKEGWPKYNVRLVEGALVVSFSSPNPDSIEQVAQRFREMGLVEGVHFTVKMPEGGGKGYVSILRKGLERAAWLSVHGEGEQRELTADFVEYILQRAKEEGEEVYEKAKEIIDEGKERGSLTLKGFEKEVEMDGKKHVVKVIGGGAEFGKGKGGKKLLRLKITAEVDGVRSDYVMTYGRYGARNAVVGRAAARAEDAERFSALVEALTGKRPWMYWRSDGTIDVVCGRAHLDGFRRYAELADAIEKWLEETGS